MQLKSIFTVVAAGVSLVMAESTSTTTSTSTMTQTKTITITECEPTATDCPLYKPPKVNSTISAAPSLSGNGTSWAVPTQKPTGDLTSVVVVPTKSNPGSPIATGAASGLYLPSSLLLSLVGAGVALLA